MWTTIIPGRLPVWGVRLQVGHAVLTPPHIHFSVFAVMEIGNLCSVQVSMHARFSSHFWIRLKHIFLVLCLVFRVHSFPFLAIVHIMSWFNSSLWLWAVGIVNNCISFSWFVCFRYMWVHLVGKD